MPDIKNDRIAIRAAILTASENMVTRFHADGLLIFDKHGRIDYCGEYIDDLFDQETALDYSGALIIPGLIDVHTHLPQLDARGNFSGELIEWLEKVIFPLESKFTDLHYAEKVTNDFFTKLISSGTTTVSLYSSHITEATELAFEQAISSGIRAFIGNTLMDVGGKQNLFTKDDIIENSKKLINQFHNTDGLVKYILTPRYAGSCSMELMKKCAEMALEHDLPIQTHIAENRAEIGFIKALFPEYDDYMTVYVAAGLIGSRTILAHCIYLNDHELNILLANDASIAHCPTSNRFLKSGIMPLRKYLDMGCKIGLGTDIAGGYNISILDEAREAIESSKYYSLLIDSNSKEITSSEAFYLATLGGACCLGIQEITGSLVQGKDADFVIMGLENGIPNSAEEALNRLLYETENRIVRETWVKGNKIWGD